MQTLEKDYCNGRSRDYCIYLLRFGPYLARSRGQVFTKAAQAQAIAGRAGGSWLGTDGEEGTGEGRHTEPNTNITAIFMPRPAANRACNRVSQPTCRTTPPPQVVHPGVIRCGDVRASNRGDRWCMSVGTARSGSRVPANWHWRSTSESPPSVPLCCSFYPKQFGKQSTATYGLEAVRLVDVPNAVHPEERRCAARADPHGREAVRLLDVPDAAWRPTFRYARIHTASTPPCLLSLCLARCARCTIFDRPHSAAAVRNTIAHPRCMPTHRCMCSSTALTSPRNTKFDSSTHAHTTAHTTRSNARDERTTRERR